MALDESSISALAAEIVGDEPIMNGRGNALELPIATGENHGHSAVGRSVQSNEGSAEMYSTNAPELDASLMSPAELQQFALQGLVTLASRGDGAAMKDLMKFTEDAYVADNSDLHGMTPAELAEEAKKIVAELEQLTMKEVISNV